MAVDKRFRCEVIALYKHETAQEKVNLVQNIIDERLRLGIDTPETEEIEMWGRPRGELQAMLDELRIKSDSFKQEDLMVVEDSKGKFWVSLLDGIYLDVMPMATREEAENYIRTNFISKVRA